MQVNVQVNMQPNSLQTSEHRQEHRHEYRQHSEMPVAGSDSQISSVSMPLIVKGRRNRKGTKNSSDPFSSPRCMKHILDVMPAGVVLVDGQGIVRQANAVAEDMLGEPLEGELWRTIIARSFRPREDDGHEISLHDGRRVKLSISPLEEEPGQLILLTDLTETRLLQQRVSHMQRLSSLGKMVASLAHQLRTPLSAATLYAANLLNPTIGFDAREQFCKKLQSRLKDLESQINDMLLFAKSGEEQVVSEVSLQSLMNEVYVGSEAMLMTKGCTLVMDVPEPDLIILGNKTALASALQNLIHNSLQHSPEGEPIRFIAQRNQDNPGDVDVLIVDSGTGIDEDKMAHIFEPFFTTRSQGTGLGLAVVKSVAQAHKGRVSVRNQNAGGACIGMHLPIHRVCEELFEEDIPINKNSPSSPALAMRS